MAARAEMGMPSKKGVGGPASVPLPPPTPPPPPKGAPVTVPAGSGAVVAVDIAEVVELRVWWRDVETQDKQSGECRSGIWGWQLPYELEALVPSTSSRLAGLWLVVTSLGAQESGVFPSRKLVDMESLSVSQQRKRDLPSFADGLITRLKARPRILVVGLCTPFDHAGGISGSVQLRTAAACQTKSELPRLGRETRHDSCGLALESRCEWSTSSKLLQAGPRGQDPVRHQESQGPGASLGCWHRPNTQPASHSLGLRVLLVLIVTGPAGGVAKPFAQRELWGRHQETAEV
jgi:hypothetical protein